MGAHGVGNAISPLSSYEPFFQECGEWKIIRKMKSAGTNYFTVVNQETLETQIINVSCFRCPTNERPKAYSALNLLLEKSSSPPFPLENDGLTSVQNSGLGQVISVDLCPSRKDFEKRFIDALLKESPVHPVPITFALTTSWIHGHRNEFDYLKNLARQNLLNITWMNHSWSHPYDRKAPYAQNFLLSPGVNPHHEILEAEQSFVENGVTPSIFFRFPGLVSNEQWIRKIKDLSLVPVGSLAWIAKGEKVDMRSLILIHGNGNEPPGIEKMLDLIGKKKIFPKTLENFSIHSM